MSTSKSVKALAGLAAGVLIFSGCSPSQQKDSDSSNTASPSKSSASSSQSPSSETGHSDHMGHGDMDHPMDGGPAPEGLKPATDAKYPVGTKVKLTADHMPGMNGAEATVVGVFDTYTYAVDYTPVDGGPEVKDHKWVVQQEIKDAGDKKLADGTEVVLNADHMMGMKGAKAKIVSSTDEPVYMVDYQSDGMTMKNHKWVVQSEISPAG